MSDVSGQLVPAYSQYLINQTIINPAYVGANNCLNINALYRQQWAGYEGAPSTRTLSAHSPFRNRSLAAGINILNDVIGVTSNTLTEGQFAYRIKLRENERLAFGAGAGIFINKNNLNELAINDKEDEVFSGRKNTVVPTFSFGTYYERNRFWAGLSTLNVTRGLTLRNAYTYQQPYYLFAGYNHKLNENINLLPSFLLKKVHGVSLQADFNVFAEYLEKVKLGISYRTEGAAYGIVQFKINPQFLLGYAYEHSLVAFRKYYNSSHEVSVRYVFEYKTTTVDVKSFE